MTAERIALLRSEPVQATPGSTDRYLLDWGTPRRPHTLWMQRRHSDPGRQLARRLGDAESVDDALLTRSQAHGIWTGTTPGSWLALRKTIDTFRTAARRFGASGTDFRNRAGV